MIIDCFLYEWYTGKYNSSILTRYHQVKNRFEYEKNLDIVPFDLRYLPILSVSSYSFRIQT